MYLHLFDPDNIFEVSRESSDLHIPRWQSSSFSVGINFFLLDVCEDDHSYWIVTDLSGAQEETIKVSASQNRIEIQADIRIPATLKENHERITLQQAYYVYACGEFRLPQAIDDGNAEACFQNGVLTIHVSKKEITRDKIIPVKKGA